MKKAAHGTGAPADRMAGRPQRSSRLPVISAYEVRPLMAVFFCRASRVGLKLAVSQPAWISRFTPRSPRRAFTHSQAHLVVDLRTRSSHSDDPSATCEPTMTSAHLVRSDLHRQDLGPTQSSEGDRTHPTLDHLRSAGRRGIAPTHDRGRMFTSGLGIAADGSCTNRFSSTSQQVNEETIHHDKQ